MAQSANLLLAGYLALMCMLVARAYYFAEPPLPATPALECKRSWRGCSPGCTKIKGKCVPKASTSTAPKASASATAGHSLMKRRTVDNCLAAANAFELAANEAIGSKEAVPLQLLAADAINCAMRIYGGGNILLVEGTSDTPANKRFWGEHGHRALGLVRAALSSDPSLRSDARTRSIELDSFMYNSAANGILKQAVTGAGMEFKKLVEEFIAAHPQWDGSVGHCFLGGFYHVAPWPLGDKKRGLREMEAAWAVSRRSRRNSYYVCLLRYLAGDASGSMEACEAALAGRCEGPGEPDFCQAVTEQTNKVIQLLRAEAA